MSTSDVAVAIFDAWLLVALVSQLASMPMMTFSPFSWSASMKVVKSLQKMSLTDVSASSLDLRRCSCAEYLDGPTEWLS